MEEIEVWSVAVGNVNPFLKASRKAIEYIAKLDGLVGVHPHYPDGTLVLFESENSAKRARNMMESKGIKCGNNICKIYIPAIYAKGGDK